MGNDHVSLSDSTADQLFADLGTGNDVFNASGALAFANQIQLNGNERAMFDKSAEAVQTLVEACKKIAPHLGKQ